MVKEGLTQRKKKPAAEEKEANKGAAAATNKDTDSSKDKKDDDDGLIYKDGKAYKRRKPTPDIWTMLSQGAPPETDADGKPKHPPAPKHWSDNLLWPGLLFLTFLLSLFIFHNAPHDASKGRKMNRYTMDNLADGGFADGGKVKPEGTWGMPGSNNQRRDEGGGKDDEKGEDN